MKTILESKYNRISRYGKRISAIDTTHAYPCERVSCYHFKGMFHVFLLKSGVPVKYRQTAKW